MLKGIDPLITPDLLKILAEMGHDDAIALVDCNFTANRLAQGRPVIRMPGAGLVAVCKAVLSLLPLEAEVKHPAALMHVSGSAPDYLSAIQRELCTLVQPFIQAHQSLETLERFAFYDRTANVSAFVVTGERQPYANIVLRKGVIADALIA